ncbi:hypothetical protein [Miltoncostaea oceani]|uniref:hypothetical protein n=1 Tax=Miltoncostaea oceani TaxID=2843216 RepID=UPI001C3E0C68|nr:hypothetical protein [Miltoncostaea oceani]
MARFVLVVDGSAEGVVLWDGVAAITLPAGSRLVPAAEWVGATERPRSQADVNGDAIRARADQAIDAMQSHIDRGTFTAAQRDAALLLVLRVSVALCRLVLGRLERE